MKGLINFRASAVLALAYVLFMTSCSDTPLTESELTDRTAFTAPSLNQVGAGPPRTGAGTWSVTAFQLISSRVVGDNTIVENRVDLEWAGALVGTSFHFNRIVIHATTGIATFQNTGEFTGTVAGCEDVESFTYSTAARGPVGAVAGVTQIIASKASTDVVLSGVIRWSQVGPGGPYDIQYVC